MPFVPNVQMPVLHVEGKRPYNPRYCQSVPVDSGENVQKRAAG